jgi:uncharacterized membrane protein
MGYLMVVLFAAVVVTFLRLSRELKGLRARVFQLENKQETAPANVQIEPAAAAAGASVSPQPKASALASRLSEMRDEWKPGAPAPTPVSQPAPAVTAPLVEPATRRRLSLLQQGIVIGLCYVAIVAAFRVYGLIGPATAFAILVGLSGFSARRAVVQNGKLLAILAVLGGFFAPIMVSLGDGNHIVLFTYYSVINGALLAIARRQSWAVLPLMGFVFTFLLGSLWGKANYQPEFFATVEAFLLLSGLLYFCVPLFFAAQAQAGRIPLYHSLIVFGTPAVVFVLQTRLVADVPFGDALSAFLMGAVYLAAVLVLWRRLEQSSAVLRDAYLGIGIVLVIISLPLALNEHAAETLWALEAVDGRGSAGGSVVPALIRMSPIL